MTCNNRYSKYILCILLNKLCAVKVLCAVITLLNKIHNCETMSVGLCVLVSIFT